MSSTPAPKPKTPEPEIEIVELIEFTSTAKLIAFLALGIAAGLACYWLVSRYVVVEDSDHA